jgi:branched-chain amino acid transport system ATP-binding protein
MLLELDHVTKHFGALTAVNDLSFSIDAGEVLGVMGPNGSGKTTLLNLIMGVYPLDSGEIRFAGQRISGLSTSAIARLGIGRTYQIPQPFPRLTVLENVLVGERYGGKRQSSRAAREHAMAILERVGLTDSAATAAGKLGLLDLKRLELARALSLQPRLLLLDELAAGLVVREAEVLKQLLLELQEAGHTMLLIEHVLNVMFDVSDRILVLNFGERLAIGSPQEIAYDPQVQAVYLGTAEKVAVPGQARDAPGQAIAPRKLLELRHVHAGYGSLQALYDVSLHINVGEIVALIGINGAGKTTLIRTINRQVPLSSGDIIFQGENIVAARPHQIVGLGIAQCLEGRKLFPALTVQENLELGAYCRRARDQRHATLARVYALFPLLKTRRHQTASTLSGGEQQMLAIGRALMARPELIMFDEISLGLAPLIIDTLYDALTRINRQGTTVLLVEQNVHRSLAVADRAYIMERGRIVLSGTTAVLRHDARVKAAYFGL